MKSGKSESQRCFVDRSSRCCSSQLFSMENGKSENWKFVNSTADLTWVPRTPVGALAFDQESHFRGSRKREVRRLHPSLSRAAPVCAGPHQSAQGRTSLRRAAPVCAGPTCCVTPPRCAQAPPQTPLYRAFGNIVCFI